MLVRGRIHSLLKKHFVPNTAIPFLLMDRIKRWAYYRCCRSTSSPVGIIIIEELDCGSVDWRFLEVDDETFANMKESVSNLRRLSIEFSTTMDCQDDYGWWFDYENGLCAETLRKGRLRDFVTSSPLLGDLDIYFSSASSNPGIQDTVGNFHLACLKDA